MRTTVLILAALAVVLTPSGAYGQKSTEMFIPIGKSPGLSGKVTYMGKIGTVDAEARTITDPTGGWKATVTATTKIWLDRSSVKLPNREGTFEDLVADRLVEVKYEGKERKRSGPAEWIKVEVKS
jgi:hypothetical protein